MDADLALSARLPGTPGAARRALTTAEGLGAWLATEVDLDAAAGRLALTGAGVPGGDRPRQELLELDPTGTLRLRWRLDDVDTEVAIALAPDASGGSRLTLRHGPLPDLAALMDPPGRRDGLHSMHTFWPLALGRLVEHLEGRTLTPAADFTAHRPLHIRAVVEAEAPPAVVFGALTDGATASRWFGWEVEIDPRPGGRITLGAEGTIRELVPGKLLVYTDPEGMVVRWTVREQGPGSRVELDIAGFGPEERDSVAQHEAGWFAGLAELRRLVRDPEGWEPLVRELPGSD